MLTKALRKTIEALDTLDTADRGLPWAPGHSDETPTLADDPDQEIGFRTASQIQKALNWLAKQPNESPPRGRKPRARDMLPSERGLWD